MIMSDDREKYFQYVQRKVKHTRLIWRTLPLTIVLASMGTALAEVMIVQFRLFKIPDSVAQYMLSNVLLQFDVASFQVICGKEGLSETAISLLIFVYYSSAVFAILPLLLVPWFGAGVAQFSRQRERRLFYSVMLLYRHLEELATESRPSLRRKATRLVLSLALADSLSPLKHNWQRRSTLAWFGQNTLSKETVRILASLKAFQKKALYCIRANSRVSELADAVNELATYLHFVNARKETFYRARQTETTPEERLCRLVKFADALNRIQAGQIDKVTIVRKVADAIAMVGVREEVRGLIVIGVLSGVVMLAGSVVFNISKSTAFLAWFSVVFGSTMIVLGTSAIARRRR